MLLFDWKKIFNATQGDPIEIVRVLRMLVLKQVPTTKYDKIYFYSQLNFSGENFLLHPELLLFHSHKHGYRDIAIYTAMASLRPLADYHAYGTVTLDPLYAPEEVLKYVDENRLLSMKDGKIHFLYERSPLPEEIH
jgi:hypothetical protein